jgi:hypothetical protein
MHKAEQSGVKIRTDADDRLRTLTFQFKKYKRKINRLNLLRKWFWMTYYAGFSKRLFVLG